MLMKVKAKRWSEKARWTWCSHLLLRLLAHTWCGSVLGASSCRTRASRHLQPHVHQTHSERPGV